jgi:protein-tyrosine phosphatase
MKILMVCLGNICRSPLAEGIMRHKINERGYSDWEVDSAGTGGWHAGERPDRRSIETARLHGIDILGQRARQIRRDDLATFDKILVMDADNYQQVLLLTQDPQEVAKVELIMNYVRPGYNMAVPDPYYGGSEGFDQVYQMLDQACEAVLQKENPTN